MSKYLYSALFLLMLAACSSRTTPPQSSSSTTSGETRLTITASPRQGFVPLRVTFRGEMEGVDQHDQEYYCLQEEWDFGDGAKSTEKPNCDPYTPDTRIKTEFFMEHVYEKDGNYTVRLVLGDKKVRARQISVIAIERDSGLN